METFVPDIVDLASLLDAAVKDGASRPFLGQKRGGRWEWTTYGEFARRVATARAALSGLGVARGDRVAVIANNRIEWAVCGYAAWTLGAVYVPMYEVQMEKDWLYILRDCAAKACFVSSDAIFDKISAMKKDLPALTHVVGFDRAPTDPTGSWSALIERARGKEVPKARIEGSDEAVFIYTSGTTGNPKGVRLTHANVTSNVCATRGIIPRMESDRGMCILPWAHAGGLAELTTLVCNGGSAGICEGVDKIVDNLGEIQPTWLVAVPRIWHRFHDAVQKGMATRPKPLQRVFRRAMRAGTARRKGEALTPKDRIAIAVAERLLYPKIRARLGGRLRFTTVGAAALSIDVAHFIENLGIRVHEVYGMTEASPVVTVMREGDGATKLGSVGRVIPGVRVEIDHDVEGGDAEQGEIVVYGHGVMLGYYGLPEETAKSIQADGGLRTGDLGRVDGEGFLYVTGRVKEVYKLENGKFVAPVPLEEKICLSPFIAQAMVYGLNKPHNVAVVVADKATLVPWCESRGVPTGDVEAMLADPRVKALFAAEIARQAREAKGYERIVEFVLTIEEFATTNDMLTPTLKLKRRNVMARHGERLLALYG
jgi:long-chain acyl-CoA synthetase